MIMSGSMGCIILAAALLLAGCDDMTHEATKKAYSAASVGPGKTPSDTTEFRERAVPPPPLTLALLERGQERFEIFCTPCHSYVGNGQGMIVQRGFSPPPSYHIDRLRGAPTQHFYDVITNGYGAMYSFAQRVPPADRWAIAAYIRALQRSQNATVTDLSPDQRAALQ